VVIRRPRQPIITPAGCGSFLEEATPRGRPAAAGSSIDLAGGEMFVIPVCYQKPLIKILAFF
jgi:hypothetical protein